jgi:hydrogenase maturation protease
MMRALIAGLGNVFESDDGFGSAVAASLAGRPPADLGAGIELEVVDFGIRGVHLAYQMLDGYDLVVLLDAVNRGGPPGTTYVIEHGPDTERGERLAGDQRRGTAMMDAHDMDPDEVLALVPALGGTLGRVVIVGCEPEFLGPGMELSPAVARSVETAAQLAMQIVADALTPAGSPHAGDRSEAMAEWDD